MTVAWRAVRFALRLGGACGIAFAITVAAAFLWQSAAEEPALSQGRPSATPTRGRDAAPVNRGNARSRESVKKLAEPGTGKTNAVQTAAIVLCLAGWMVPVVYMCVAIRRAIGKRRKCQCVRGPPDWSLSRNLIAWNESDGWTIGDACQGCQIFGSTGSGKTTGPLAAILRAFLNMNAGFGGLLLTCKPDDRDNYLRYIREAGREKDVLLFGPDHGLRFNFINSELASGAGMVENLATLLTTVSELNERNTAGGGRESEGFWKTNKKRLARNTIQLEVMAKGAVTVADLQRICVSAPTSLDDVASAAWRKDSYCFECLTKADGKPKSPMELADFELVANFFLKEWPTLSDRTRSVILSDFLGTLDILNRGVVRELISSPDPNVRPEMVHDGKIILVDMPVLVYQEMGQYVQSIIKLCLQRAQSRRDVSRNARPVFIVCDESHLLTVSTDQVFQTTARSSRTCVVNATQSISNYLAALGGEKSEPEVHSLLGNLQTQVFCQQTDIKTNQYAAEIVGRSRQILCNSSNTYAGDEGVFGMMGMNNAGQTSAGLSESMDFELTPHVLTSLPKGGPPAWEVGAIVYQGGKRFAATGKTYLPVRFKQKP